MTQKVCSIEGCGRPAHARGWCMLHYIRWWRKGDPLAGVAVRPHAPRCDWIGRDETGRPYCRHGLAHKSSSGWQCREKRRASNLLHRYGLTLLEYQAMLARQRGFCAACGLPFNGDIHVDHDADVAPGRVSALLHGACNRSAGLLGHDPARIRALADYVENRHALSEQYLRENAL